MRARRNIGIVAHIDAGKTTLTEQILHATSVLRRPGSVDDGSTVSDWQRQEQERGITIGSAAVVCRWKDVELTLIDTPGHVDFGIEVSRALTVLDGTVVIFSAPDGVQAQTQTVWHQVAQHELPAIGFVNKLDRPGYNHESMLEQIRERLGIEPLPLYIPLHFGASELILLDVLGAKRLRWTMVQKKVGVREPELLKIEDEYEELLQQVALERIADAIASSDDLFAERYLSGAPLEVEQWLSAIGKATRQRRVLPLLFGVARSGVGPSQLLDHVLALLPSPDEVLPPYVFDPQTGNTAGRLRSEYPSAFVFKTERRPRGERLAHIRAFSGVLHKGDSLRILPNGERVRALRLVRLLGSEEIEVASLRAGSVGALQYLDEGSPLRTGQTLIGGEGPAFSFESLTSPTPVISISIEAEDEEEDARMRLFLEEAIHDDPSLALLHDRHSGQTLLAGMGELHLELLVERLQQDEGLRVRLGQPRARLRQMLTGPVESELTHRHEGPPRGSVYLRVGLTPSKQSEIEVLDHHTGLHIGPIEQSALQAGMLHALEQEADIVGVNVRILDLSLSGGAVNPRMLWDAGHAAALKALTSTTVRAAEPWMRATIASPELSVGRVSGDLARRRAKILGSESRGAVQVLHVEVPLTEMIHYATALRSLTAGRGTFSMRPSRFRIIPGESA